MEFKEAIPVTFKEITPNYETTEKWKEVVLNTGGTHSTLQDIKLPPKAGGYWYKESLKANTRNRFIYWQTTADAIELSEASLDVNLVGANLRCKVAPGTPPLNGLTVWERHAAKELIILAATVSSVHRFVFPHPVILDKKATFGSLITNTPSVFQDTSAINNPSNYYILNQYSNPNIGVAHTCTSLLRDTGEAVFALAFGYGGDGALLLVKMPVSGAPVMLQLKRESAVPRFLSGITGALRGKSDGVETSGVVLTARLAVALCADACLRAWPLDEGGAPRALSAPLTQDAGRPGAKPQGHMLQQAPGGGAAAGGGCVLVAYLSFPDEGEFVALRMTAEGGAVKFAHLCRIFGPQLDLMDYTLGYGDGANVIWALWSQPDGETVVTSTALSAEVSWRAVAARVPLPALPALAAHAQYRELLLAAAFPRSVVMQALRIYRRQFGGSDAPAGAEAELSEACAAAVQARLRHLAARAPAADHSQLMHKCWSDLYSWCVQYMEGLQKPLGLMVSQHEKHAESGWWCAVVRRAGVSLVRELEPLERMMLAPDEPPGDNPSEPGELSADAARVVRAGAAWERAATPAAAAELERQVFSAAAPLRMLRHRTPAELLSPQQIDELSAILEPIRDLQSAVLELNDALRLDVPDLDTSKDDEENEEYENLFKSDLGVAVVTEAIRQMADMRSRLVRGVVCALGAARGPDGVPGAAHCAVHWQAYRALRACCRVPRATAPPTEQFQLKLASLGGRARPASLAGGLLHAYAADEGGARARSHLAAAAAPPQWQHAAPLMAHHVAYQLWAVSGGFEFGWWLASVNQPRLVQSYVAALEPWCEWNACSRQFILGLSLLELDDAEAAYAAFSKAAKGVGCEAFLRRLVAPAGEPLSQHRALVLYYMKVIKLFEIHDAGACVVRLAETAISIADKDDPNLGMFQWVVFQWHVSRGSVARALGAAAACAPKARPAAAAALITALTARRQLSALVSCSGLSAEVTRAAATRARLHPAERSPSYDLLLAMHVHRQHYREAAAVLYERAARAGAESGDRAARRRFLAAALAALRLARPEHAFLTRAAAPGQVQVIGPEELEAELREEDPDSMDPVQRALVEGGAIDFTALLAPLQTADGPALRAVLTRAVSHNQHLPHWFLERYMSVDSSACTRALLAGGRLLEAGALCTAALRRALRRLSPAAPAPAAAPLAAADLLLHELDRDDARCREAYDELNHVVKEYMEVVTRTSEDMKLARIEFPVST